MPKLVKTVNCEYGDWVWYPCPITCGEVEGLQTGHRNISQHPENGGQPCDGPFVTQRKCTDTTNTPCPGICYFHI